VSTAAGSLCVGIFPRSHVYSLC